MSFAKKDADPAANTLFPDYAVYGTLCPCAAVQIANQCSRVSVNVNAATASPAALIRCDPVNTIGRDGCCRIHA